MTDQEAIEACIGIVTALQSEILGDEGWRDLLHVVIGDASISDMEAITLQMGGLVLGCILAMTHHIPEMRNMTAAEYIRRLGAAAAAIERTEIEGQGRLFGDEDESETG